VVPLREDGNDPVTDFECSDVFADGFDYTGSI
jgi:hypothetical protein